MARGEPRPHREEGRGARDRADRRGPAVHALVGDARDRDAVPLRGRGHVQHCIARENGGDRDVPCRAVQSKDTPRMHASIGDGQHVFVADAWGTLSRRRASTSRSRRRRLGSRPFAAAARTLGACACGRPSRRDRTVAWRSCSSTNSLEGSLSKRSLTTRLSARSRWACRWAEADDCSARSMIAARRCCSSSLRSTRCLECT
jgi:hypothetical protein